MDIKMPDLNDYNISNPGEMALYHAYCDFYPFRSVLETINEAISSTVSVYGNQVDIAREENDILVENQAMTNGALFLARVTPLVFYSVVLTMVSVLEEFFNTLCRAYYIMNKYSISQKDISGQGLERAILYLDKVVGVKNIKNDANWEYVKTIRDARNIIVHNGGNVSKSDIKKFEKFGIYVDDESNKMFFEYHDLLKMYESIIEFIDRVFKKEPNDHSDVIIN